MKKTKTMRRIEKERGEDIQSVLTRMYIEEEKNSHTIAKELGLISNTTVINWLRAHDIQVRAVDEPKMSIIEKLNFFPEQLREFIEKCTEEGLRDNEIGRRLGTDALTIIFIRREWERKDKRKPEAGGSINSLIF